MAIIAFFFLLFLFFAALIYLYSWLPHSSPAKIAPQPQITTTNKNSDGLPTANHHEEELKSVFATFDKNGDGFITKQELIDSFKNIRIIMTEKEVDEMVVNVDSNGDGLIDFNEFCNLYQNKRGEEDEDGDLKEAFEVFDRDNDGLISVDELGSVLCSIGLKKGTTAQDCKEMIRKVDKDGDGMVNFDEFKNMMIITK